MKNYPRRLTVFAVTCFLFVTFSNAQLDGDALHLRIFGIGLHAEQYKISDVITSSFNAYNSTVLLPLNLTQHFRVEPEFGVLWMNDKEDEETSLGISGGFGLFGMFQKEKVNFYVGIRFLVDALTMDGFYSYNGESSKEKYRALKTGPALGFEYFLINHFSIGGEFGLRYVSSKTSYDIPDTELEDSKAEMFNFDSGLFVRAYF